MEFFRVNEMWNESFHPFDGMPASKWMYIGSGDGIAFHCHSCSSSKTTRLHLTENSYMQVLEMILDAYPTEQRNNHLQGV